MECINLFKLQAINKTPSTQVETLGHILEVKVTLHSQTLPRLLQIRIHLHYFVEGAGYVRLGEPLHVFWVGGAPEQRLLFEDSSVIRLC